MSAQKIKILLAEDDPNLGNLLQEYLSAKGYQTDLAVNGKEGADFFRKNQYDLCLLDIMMPVKDGFALAREIRERDKNIPIIFLTAKSMKEDTIEGFKIGADDYMTKPFVMEELLLRVNAILRRSKNQETLQTEKNEFRIGKFKFNCENQTLEIKNASAKSPVKIIELTTKEAELLKLLCTHGTVDRNFVLTKIWGSDDYFKARSMDVFIAKLRKILKADPSVEILNLHGKGFRLVGVK